jgi:hypothetical protein
MVRVSGPQVAAAVLIVWVTSAGGHASAQEPAAPALKVAAGDAISGITPPMSAPPPAALVEPRRPGALVPLYASFAAFQVVDAQSTLHALSRGGVEANPIMKGIAGKPVALVAVKAAATTGVIVASEKMWKKNRTAAVVFMLAANSAMAWVVQNNYRAAR